MNASCATLRAPEGILFDKGFTIELGGVLLAEITPCQQQEKIIPATDIDSEPLLPHEGYIKAGHY
ncbi:MAG: hypothetical protein FJY07_04680 [Bacteroidetes bacterium]|nr:hypothetical protein [Bacteroidota bacterium]